MDLSNKCARGGGVCLDKNENPNNDIKLNNKKQLTAGKYLVIFALFILCLGFMLGVTYSALSSTKTATGSITFALTNSPEMSMNINYAVGQDKKTYLGTTQGAEISSSTDVLRVNIKDNSSLKVQLTFSGSAIILQNGLTLSTNNGVSLSLQSNTNGVAIWQASSVNANDYLILDKLLSGVYPNVAINNSTYELSISSQASGAVPATAKLIGIYSASYDNYIVTLSKNADYGTLSQSSISVPYGSTYSASSNVLTFKDLQGNTLQTITATKYNNTAQYTYSFSSWSSTSGTITSATTITANFGRTTNQYTVTFYNYNGTQLGTSTVAYGGTATYSGSTPTRAETNDYTYEFIGWVTTQGGSTTDNLTNVVANRSVYANFKANAKATAYTVTIESTYDYSVVNDTRGGTISTGGKAYANDSITVSTTTGVTIYAYKVDASGNETQFVNYRFVCGPSRSTTFTMPESNIIIRVDKPTGGPTVGCCVYEDTLITLADGTTKRADEIEIGDKILNYNFETGELEVDTITDILQRNRLELITINFTDGTQLKITNDHPLFTELGWKCYDCELGSMVYGNLGITDSFKVGDKLFSLSKYFDKEIESITYEENEKGYNTYQFGTEKNDNYFANGVLSADL